MNGNNKRWLDGVLVDNIIRSVCISIIILVFCSQSFEYGIDGYISSALGIIKFWVEFLLYKPLDFVVEISIYFFWNFIFCIPVTICNKYVLRNKNAKRRVSYTIDMIFYVSVIALFVTLFFMFYDPNRMILYVIFIPLFEFFFCMVRVNKWVKKTEDVKPKSPLRSVVGQFLSHVNSFFK